MQVLFRHGARTPVTRSDEYWKGTTWDVCGEKLEALTKSLRKGTEKTLPVPNIAVLDKETLKLQETCIDQSWDAKIIKGGCSQGELTKLGQEQVGTSL
jgi:lysophosphatidic acid phosphatase type 6